MQQQKEKWIQDKRIGFCERNISRWTGAWGVRSRTANGKVERILERRNELGQVTKRLRIGAVGFNGVLHLISFEHKKMWNLIERLFDRQGCPADCWIELSSIAFYDFLFDIASMDEPGRRKFRDAKRYADMVHSLLMVLSGTPWWFEDWETKNSDGSGMAVKPRRLVEGFEMNGRTPGGTYGKIRIKLNEDVANSLRERNTTPILIEVQNAIKSPTAGILYGYLSQILFKMPYFEMDVLDLAERLQIGRVGNVVRDFRRAASELEGLDFASGRIIECKVVKRGRSYSFCAKRALRERRVPHHGNAAALALAEERRFRDSQFERAEYLKRFRELPTADKERCQLEVDTILAPLGERLNFGRTIHVENAIIAVMEQHFTRKNDQLTGRICAPVLRERSHTAYLSNSERDAFRSLVEVLNRVAKHKSEAVS